MFQSHSVLFQRRRIPRKKSGEKKTSVENVERMCSLFDSSLLFFFDRRIF